MTKRIKLFLISAVICLMAVATVFTTLNANTASASQQTLTGSKAQAEVTAEVDLSSFALTDSASIRTEQPNGIRFQTTVSKAEVANLPNNAVFGTLMLPTELLGENELTLTTDKVADVKAIVYNENGDNYEYVTALVGSKNGSGFNDFDAKYYNKEITARSYVTYTYGEDESATTVTKYSNAVSWSVGQTAGNLLAKKYDELGIEQVTFLKGVLDVVKTPAFAEENIPTVYAENIVDGVFALDLAFADSVIGVMGESVTGFEKVDSDTINVTLSDATVTGKVTFLAITEKATYEVTVNVIVKPTVEMSISEIDLSNNPAIALTELGLSSDYAGSISVTLDDVQLEVTIADGKINLPSTITAWGEKVLVIETDEKIVNASVLLITKVIGTPAEMQAFIASQKDIAIEYDPTETNRYYYDGYYVLSADLDMQGADLTSTLKLNNDDYQKANTGFRGVFDGRGHYVSNFKTTKLGGMFGAISSVGVVKNVAFVESTVSAADGNGAGLLGFGVHGTLENCIISTSVASTSKNVVGGIARRVTTATLKNVVIAFNNYSANTAVGAISYETRAAVKCDNVYVFSAVGTESYFSGGSYTANEMHVYKTVQSLNITDLEGAYWAADTFTTIPVFENLGSYTSTLSLEDKSDIVYFGIAPNGTAVALPTVDLTGYNEIPETGAVLSGSVTAGQQLDLSANYTLYDAIVPVGEDGTVFSTMQLRYYDKSNKNYMHNVGTFNGVDNAHKIITDPNGASWTDRIQFLMIENNWGADVAKVFTDAGFNTISMKLYLTQSVISNGLTFQQDNNSDGFSFQVSNGKVSKYNPSDRFIITDSTGKALVLNQEVTPGWYNITADITTLKATNNNIYTQAAPGTEYYYADVILSKGVVSYSVGDVDLSSDRAIDLTKIGESAEYNGDVKVSVDNVAYDGAYIGNGKIILPTGITAFGEKQVVITLDNRVVIANALLITDLMTTPEEVIAFATTGAGQYGTKTGYYVLGANINMNGVEIESDLKTYGNANHGFQGVFDGRGYSISNFQVNQYGVFGTIAGVGVVKNTGFLNVYMQCDQSAAGGILSYNCTGTITDVRISLVAGGSSIGFGTVTYGARSGCVLNNIVIDIENRNQRATKDNNENKFGSTVLPYDKADSSKYTNIYVIRDNTNVAENAWATHYYGTQTAEMTFTGLSSDIWNLSGPVPTMKHAYSYTTEHLIGNTTTGNYVAYNKYYKSDIPGATVSTSAITVFSTQITADAASSTLSATLSADNTVELKAYYGIVSVNKSNNSEYIAFRGDNGEVTPVTLKGNGGNSSVSFATATVAGKTAYKVENVKTGWTDLIRLSTMYGANWRDNTNTYITGSASGKNGLLQLYGYKTMTFDFYAETTVTGMYFGGNNLSAYGSVSIATIGTDSNGNSQDWITAVDAEGNAVTAITQGAWYTITIDLTEFYLNNSSGSMYLDTAAGASYYIANPRVSKI